MQNGFDMQDIMRMVMQQQMQNKTGLFQPPAGGAMMNLPNQLPAGVNLPNGAGQAGAVFDMLESMPTNRSSTMNLPAQAPVGNFNQGGNILEMILKQKAAGSMMPLGLMNFLGK